MTASVRQYPLQGCRVSRLVGSDGRDLLQRISTADVSPLASGRSVATLLTNEKGRVVDLIGVVPESERSLLVVGTGDHDGRVARWLERFIIMEDVAVSDVSSQWDASVLYTVGSDGRWTLPDMSNASVAAVAMGLHRWGLSLAPKGHAVDGTSLVDQAAFAMDRVSSGVPWIGAEFGEDRNPLEARLRPLVSFTKGCYIGQEVIARLDAYRKVSMALTRFTGTIDGRDETPITLTAPDGSAVGVVTTAVRGADTATALGFLRMSAMSQATLFRSAHGSELAPIDTDPDASIYH
jgi:folate-binding protein YgfZ